MKHARIIIFYLFKINRNLKLKQYMLQYKLDNFQEISRNVYIFYLPFNLIALVLVLVFILQW